MPRRAPGIRSELPRFRQIDEQKLLETSNHQAQARRSIWPTWSSARRSIRNPIVFVGAVCVLGVSSYSSYFYFSRALRPSYKIGDGKTVSRSDSSSPGSTSSKDENPVELLTDFDVSARYQDDEYASKFDREVGWTESLTLLNRLRKNLVKQAQGHVLEASVGTGRNAAYYRINQCKSITFLDQSGPMVKIAREKWTRLYPKASRETNIAFRVQDLQEDIPMPAGGFDTIIQTMGTCSTSHPVEAIQRLGRALNPQSGRLLLLEHGRGWYDWINWVLDKDATRHADRFGCWFNRDIGQILQQSGLVIERCERPYWWNLGTVWVIEARHRDWKKAG